MAAVAVKHRRSCVSVSSSRATSPVTARLLCKFLPPSGHILRPYLTERKEQFTSIIVQILLYPMIRCLRRCIMYPIWERYLEKKTWFCIWNIRELDEGPQKAMQFPKLGHQYLIKRHIFTGLLIFEGAHMNGVIFFLNWRHSDQITLKKNKLVLFYFNLNCFYEERRAIYFLGEGCIYHW